MYINMDFHVSGERVNWAGEARPTLGYSIKISRDIYACRYVGLTSETRTKNTYAKIRGRNYVAQTRSCSVLFISTIR